LEEESGGAVCYGGFYEVKAVVDRGGVKNARVEKLSILVTIVLF